jgi:ABC-type phosphate transport system substrate-binding protein
MKNLFKRALVGATLGLAALAAQAQIAVVTGPSGATPSKDQLSNIYLGRSFDLKPIDMPEGNALREQFYSKLTGRDQNQIKAVWARVVFTGKGQAPLMLPDAASIKKAVSTDPKAIGYIDKASVDGSVKVLMMLE